MNNIKLLSVVTPLSIYNGLSTQNMFWKENFTQVNIKIVVFEMLKNIGKSRMVSSKSYWTSLWSLVIWTRWRSHIHEQTIIWEDKVRSWLPLWVSRPLEGQKRLKRKSFPLLKSVSRIFLTLLSNVRLCLMRVIWGRGPNTFLLKVISI